MSCENSCLLDRSDRRSFAIDVTMVHKGERVASFLKRLGTILPSRRGPQHTSDSAVQMVPVSGIELTQIDGFCIVSRFVYKRRQRPGATRLHGLHGKFCPLAQPCGISVLGCITRTEAARKFFCAILCLDSVASFIFCFTQCRHQVFEIHSLNCNREIAISVSNN